MRWTRAAGTAVLAFLAIYAFRLASVGPHGTGPDAHAPFVQQSVDPFNLGRRNYASGKKHDGPSAAPPFPSPGLEGQKYEKIGSLTQISDSFDTDRQKVEAAIRSHGGLVQLERATGLHSRRNLQLGIGVPPTAFDAFVETVRGIGRNAAIEIVKNDKTNEYLQLRAKRATLEKARAALEELKAGGGSLDERIKVQNRLTEIEQQLQDLGVSMGEFDSQNELCTVKLTLQERAKVVTWSLSTRAWRALLLALTDYAQLGVGFFGLMAAAWIGARVLRELLRIARGDHRAA